MGRCYKKKLHLHLTIVSIKVKKVDNLKQKIFRNFVLTPAAYL